MTPLNVLLQIQATGAAAADTLNQVADSAIQAAPQTVEMSYWEMAKKGGPFIMIPMLIMSFIAVYIFIERWVAIKKASKEDTTFMDRIKDYIMDGKLDSATNLCQQANTPAARMIEKGISRIGKPLNDIQTAIENVGNVEVSKLEKGVALIGMISGAAPMLGFLGTVTGMIRAFYDMSMAGNNIDIELLSAGIYEAMVTTVGGLIVGIIAIFAYNYLVARVDKAQNLMEADIISFLEIVSDIRNGNSQE